MTDLDFAGVDTKLPPQYVEAELAILGGLILDPPAYHFVSDILAPEMFYISSHRDIYRAIQKMNLLNKPTDLLALTSYLSDNDLLQKVGGRNKLSELVESTVSATNIDHLSYLVKDAYTRRQMIAAGNKIVQLGYDTSRELADTVVNAEKTLFDATDGAVANAECESAADILVGFYEEIEQRNQGLLAPGITTGFYDLDAMLDGGLQRDQFYIIAGRPAMGKTGFATNIAQHIASEGMPVVFFSLEMSKRQLMTRMISAEARIEMSYLKSGRLSSTTGQWEDLSKAVARVSEMPIFISDSSTRIDFLTMRSTIRRLQKEHGQLGVIVIDYLQLLEDRVPSNMGQNQAQRLGYVSHQLASMSKEFNTPVVALAQLGRDVDDRNNKRPTMSDIKGSGDIEQDADVVITLYRDEYYSPDTTERGIAEVIIAKNRHGAPGTIKLLFDGQFTQFKNKAR